MKRTEFFHFRYILNPILMPALDSIYANVDRNANLVRHFFSDAAYVLGRSNWTAKARGGIMVAAFLAKSKEGGFDIITDHAGDPNADKILWVVRRCSEKENYNRAESRNKALYRAQAGSNMVLVSGNYEYPVVKQIALKLMELSEYHYKHSYTKFQVWKTLKDSFNIDEWVKNAFQSSNTTVRPPILSTRAKG